MSIQITLKPLVGQQSAGDTYTHPILMIFAEGAGVAAIRGGREAELIGMVGTAAGCPINWLPVANAFADHLEQFKSAIFAGLINLRKEHLRLAQQSAEASSGLDAGSDDPQVVAIAQQARQDAMKQLELAKSELDAEQSSARESNLPIAEAVLEVVAEMNQPDDGDGDNAIDTDADQQNL
jgi:hypothetical protein